MPTLLNLWYEQLSYPKILPLVYNLSMKISRPRSLLERFVPPQQAETRRKFGRLLRISQLS